MIHAPFFAGRWRAHTFAVLTTFLLLFAVGHTLWSTSLDGFTIDEPYHIAAGATYLQLHDYRINPEHPPLVKLVVALAEPAGVLHLGPLPELDDKQQERVWTQTVVYKDSDYHRVQRRARTAMIVFNTVLLLALAVTLRRVFSPEVALAALLLLALDPTVSAHMPVVMTDLPMALLGTICASLAILALRCRRWLDWMLLGVACGLFLGTKHSAPLVLLPILIGCVIALVWRRFKQEQTDIAAQTGRLTVALLLSIAVLWSLYGFRYHESRARDAQGNYVETFNRTLEKKITDLESPVLRHVLAAADKARLLPRAYLWGMADTLRAGVEGRPSLVRAWGKDYFDKAPWWIPFADLLVKVPLPFFALALAGILLLARGKLDSRTAWDVGVYIALFVFFMAFIARNGVFYAGLRHWLLDVPLLAVPAAIAMDYCLHSHRRWLPALPALALLLIAAPTLPQRRIWEYHNILAGGTYNAWKYFNNESVELGQRNNENIAFYREHVAPELPLTGVAFREQAEAEHIGIYEPKPEDVADGRLAGWFFFKAPNLPVKNWEHIEAFRDAQPVARIGTTIIYHGSFYLPYGAGGALIGQGLRQVYLPHGDRTKAERYLQHGVMLNPESPVAFIELGNFALKRGEKEAALTRYRQALAAEKDSEQVRQLIRQHIARVEAGAVQPMRNPFAE